MYKYWNSSFVKYALGLIELMLGLAFILKSLNAGTDAPFVYSLYAVTDALSAPFEGMFRDRHLRNGGMFDLAYFSAMIIYMMLVFIPVALHGKYKKEKPIVPPVNQPPQ